MKALATCTLAIPAVRSLRLSRKFEDRERAEASSFTGGLIMNPGGYGFVSRPAPLPSVFIPPHRMGGALDGDRVRVRAWTAEKGDEGEILEVLKRRRTKIVGVLRREGSRGFTIDADDPRVVHRVALVQDPPAQAREGQLVAAHIVGYPGPNDSAIEVRFEQVIGDPGVLSVEVQKILIEQGIDESFSSSVRREARRTPKEVRASDIEAREDLRAIPFMTIDPPDARDFDDAVAVEFPDGDRVLGVARLYVAVADVSHYVRPGTEIDQEARARCFSVYLPDRSIPMLPEALSSHMCSLVPHEDRLAMVVRMDIDAAGEVTATEMSAAVIHSQKRLTYDQAAAVLNESGHDLNEVEVQRIRDLRAVADRLRSLRMQRGALELEIPESKILLDQDDPERIRDIVPTRANRSVKRAYNLIEELMLAANESVGRYAEQHQLPVIYRIHAPPDTEKIEQFVEAVSIFDLEPKAEKLATPRGMQKFISKLGGHPQGSVLQVLLLRCMSQAMYSAEQEGHFALASSAYVHFTSPIRRYADLISHRVIKGDLIARGRFEGGASLRKLPSTEECEEAALSCSDLERSIQQVERGIKAVYSAAFMRDKIGERYEGQVTGLNGWGAFVTLRDPMVDGFIPLNRRDEEKRYELVEGGTRLADLKSNHSVSLGEILKVEVVDVSLVRRQVEFERIDGDGS